MTFKKWWQTLNRHEKSAMIVLYPSHLKMQFQN